MRSGHQIAIRGATTTSTTNCMVNRSDSTEDLWNEDSYIYPETSYLSSPEYFVNVTPVQPDYEPLCSTSQRRPSLKNHSRKPNVRNVQPYHHLQEDQVPILQPPPEFDQYSSCSRNDSLSSDTKFDIILASLQNLAQELEKDFEQDEEVVKHDTIENE